MTLEDISGIGHWILPALVTIATDTELSALQLAHRRVVLRGSPPADTVISRAAGAVFASSLSNETDVTLLIEQADSTTTELEPGETVDIYGGI